LQLAAGLFGGTVDNFRAARMAATIAITACLRFGSGIITLGKNGDGFDSEVLSAMQTNKTRLNKCADRFAGIEAQR
jgi:hypothetical protein